MLIPWWAPFAVPFFVGAVVLDKLTGGAISAALKKNHAEEINKHFGWKELPHDNPRR
jgi:hypothetical protein